MTDVTPPLTEENRCNHPPVTPPEGHQCPQKRFLVPAVLQH